MIFYGYKSENDMRKANPTLADHLVSIAEELTLTTCSEGAQCTGSIDGKVFEYADGSQDHGRKTKFCRAVLGDKVFQWQQNKKNHKPRNLVMTDSEAIEILEGMCWTLRARFTDDSEPHEDYEWVVEGCGGVEKGKGDDIVSATQNAYKTYMRKMRDKGSFSRTSSTQNNFKS